MPDLRLTEVAPSDVGDRDVLAFTSFPDAKPFITGTGPLNVLCARCSFVLLEKAEPAGVQSSQLLIRCPSCGTLNAADESVAPPEGRGPLAH